jgi:signal transduction histidine kinase
VGDTVLDGVLDLYAKRLLSKGIAISKQTRSDGASINSFPGKIRQVLSTLLLNAMEAVPSGGTISIGIRKSYHWKDPVSVGVPVAIADSGVGIPPHNIARTL